MTTTFDHSQLNDFRAKVLAGEEIDETELRGAIEYLANLRAGIASTAAAPSKAKKTPAKSKAKAAADAEAMLGDLLQ